jgi:aromatic amino acid aminotransferase I
VLTIAYPGLLSPAASLGLNCIGVPMDEQGITPESLDQIMSTWDEAARGGPKPKLLILVP